jgi:cyclic lactone autoinducer peptide
MHKISEEITMKKATILSRLALAGVKCLERVAAASASSACVLYFYQPKTPANLTQRLKKS